MRNADYWQKRFEAVEEMTTSTAENFIPTIERIFTNAQQDLQNQISGWYNRFATNNNIDLAEARRLLNSRELEEFKWTVDEYINFARRNTVSQQWTQQLENASTRFRLSRLEALQIQTQNTLERAFGNHLDAMDNLMKRQFLDNYYHPIFEMQSGFNVGWDVAGIDEPRLNALLSRPWTKDNLTFSDRIWRDKDRLVNELHTQLTQGLITGTPPKVIIENLASSMNTKKSNVARLVMTESAAFAAIAHEVAYRELEVEIVRILATLDKKTSEICQKMDGKTLRLAEYKAGVTVPPFHPWCRSTTIPHFDDNFGERVARDKDGKTVYVPSDMNYTEWKETFIDGGGKNNLTSLQSSIKINDRDGHTVVISIEPININDKVVVEQQINNFAEQHSNADVEYSRIISSNGNVYTLRGIEIAVDPTFLGDDILRGGISIHNHPLDTWGLTDSFSLLDLKFAIRYDLRMSYLISNNRKNAFEFTSIYTEDEIEEAWKSARAEMYNRSRKRIIEIEHEQEEILKILNEVLEGFVFYEDI